MTPAAVVDAEGALTAYVNSLTTTLVGAGHPLTLGAWLGDGPRQTERPRGKYAGAYAVLSRVGGGPNATDQMPWDYPRVSASIYGLTRLQAATAAIAYANTLLALDGTPVTVTWTPQDQAVRQAVLLVVDQVTGPTEIRGGSEPQYLVDAVIVCTPA